MPVCVLFVYSALGAVFNPIAGAITDHNQSANDLDPYLKCQLYVEYFDHRNPGIHFSE